MANNNHNPSDEDADLLSMIRQHLTEAETNIRQAKQRRPVDPDAECDLLELDNLDTGGRATGMRAPPRDMNRAPSRVGQPTLDNIWSGSPLGPASKASLPKTPAPRVAAPQPQLPPQRPQSKPAPQQKKAAPVVRSKKKHPVRRFFAAILVITLFFGSMGFGFAYFEAGKVRFAEAGDDAVSRPRASELRSSAFVTNILLLGVDGEESDASLRSDTMLLLSVDRRDKTLKLTSFLRDSWVELPDGEHAKLNAAFARGGAEMVMATLELNFRIRIDYYLMVDYAGFRGIVDSLGGVDVAVTDKEADFLCKTTRLGKQIGREGFSQQMREAGAVHFTGEQALIYCRIRKLDSDFWRTSRQQKVLNAIVAKIRTSSPFVLLELPDAVLPCIRTDMSRLRLTRFLICAPIYMGYETERHSVPASDTYKNAKKKGSDVLELDFDANITQLKEFIYGR